MIDPEGHMRHAVFEFAFVFDVAATVVVQFGLVVDLRPIVLLGGLRLTVPLSVGNGLRGPDR